MLGIERDAYATQSGFMAAVEDALTELTAHPEDPARIDDIAKRMHLDADTVTVLKEQKTAEMLVGLIEKALGLDRLDVSLATAIKAGADPDSAEADTMRAALIEQATEARHRIGWDDLGLYRPPAVVDRAVA